MLSIIEKYWQAFVIAILVIIVAILSFLLINKKDKNMEDQPISNELSYTSNSKEDSEEITTKIKVDIKGAVSKPGVYELDAKSVVNDAIKIAGGLKKSADTSNINLSKELANEMVIKIFTTNELKKLNKSKEVVTNDNICQENTIIIDKCNESQIIKDVDTPNSNDITINIDETNNNKTDDTNNNSEPSTSKKLVSINTATIEELVTIPSIGESKAKTIITYREEHGFFKTIEDIKNVSGIGEAVYQKIKEYITI